MAALGVPVETFRAWLRDGQRRRRNDRQRVLGESLRKAAAQARLKAEVELYRDDPLKWLLHGPGRETPTLPGWSLAAHAGLAPGETTADEVHGWQFVQKLYAVLNRHPEAHAEVLELCRAREANPHQ